MQHQYLSLAPFLTPQLNNELASARICADPIPVSHEVSYVRWLASESSMCRRPQRTSLHPPAEHDVAHDAQLRTLQEPLDGAREEALPRVQEEHRRVGRHRLQHVLLGNARVRSVQAVRRWIRVWVGLMDELAEVAGKAYRTTQEQRLLHKTGTTSAATKQMCSCVLHSPTKVIRKEPAIQPVAASATDAANHGD